MHNIYIDGSYNHENKLIGIGIYDSSNGFELAMVKNGENVSEAETEALEECLRYCKMNNIVKYSRIFTDSKEIHVQLYNYVINQGIREFIWIPRELNTKADKLSAEYKQYTKNVRTKISFNNNSVIKTTKIKEVSLTKSLSKEQIIEILNQFSEQKRIILIEKLKDYSNANQLIYNYYFNGANKLSKQKRNTYFYLIPLLLSNTRNKSNIKTLIDKITIEGINNLLKHVKMKETK